MSDKASSSNRKRKAAEINEDSASEADKEPAPNRSKKNGKKPPPSRKENNRRFAKDRPLSAILCNKLSQRQALRLYALELMNEDFTSLPADKRQCIRSLRKEAASQYARMTIEVDWWRQNFPDEEPFQHGEHRVDPFTHRQDRRVCIGGSPHLHPALTRLSGTDTPPSVASSRPPHPCERHRVSGAGRHQAPLRTRQTEQGQPFPLCRLQAPIRGPPLGEHARAELQACGTVRPLRPTDPDLHSQPGTESSLHWRAYARLRGARGGQKSG